MSRVELTQFSVELSWIELKICSIQLKLSWKCKQLNFESSWIQNVNLKLNLMISLSKANQVQIKLNTSQTVKHAKVSFDWEQWKLAFRSELDTHIKNNIFTLKTSSSNQQILSTRWVTIIKRELKEKMIKYKAKWVCKRFRQKQKIDYDEIFTLMIRIMIIKMLLTLMIKYDYEVEQMNVIIAFLKAHLKKEIWMQQSSKFKQKELNEIFLTCHLNKTLYELKQMSQEWYATLKVYLIFINYQRIEIDHSMFIHDNDIIIARLIIKLSFDINLLTWLKYSISIFWLSLNTRFQHSDSTWYQSQVDTRFEFSTQLIKKSNMTSRKLNIEIFPVFRLCITFLHYLFDRKS